ncbi:J domain-containing protein 1 [Saxophila tyrrhenica]|uniref:J domain-containing protein 1 n=1 Tax=Saxophila tyrrhenica TaxID=1690608 RepID=A0AAV9PGH2_9PEZI|nr:J domain-containing protein 1 [Saxophila tyrrhenica]
MLIKYPSLFAATYTSFQTSTFSASSTSLKRKRTAGTRQCQNCQNAPKTYATIAGETDDHNDGNAEQQGQHAWPTPPAGQKCPTPYQIFQMKHNAAYTKSRFYHLVKQYHPDRATSNSNNHSVSHAVKMERYRLIVAANDILSDPTKRSAYDRFGAGWNGNAAIPTRRNDSDPAGPFSQNWNSNPSDPIWKNATWEDWERFYHARAKANGTAAEGVHNPNRTGLYLQNSYFLLVVMALALMGSTANYSRAQNEGQYFVDQRDIIHDRSAKDLRKARQEALHSGSKEDRVQWFLRNREATMGVAGSDIETLREEKVDRLLPDRDVCRSEEVKEKD